MSKLLKQSETSGPARILSQGPAPIQIQYRNALPNLIKFKDGSVLTASCIGCRDRPCYRYNDEELNASPLENFPTDKIQQVCPTNVIEPKGDNGLPTIRTDGCVLCGVCVSRCPVGAIFIDPTRGATVQTETNGRFVESDDIQEIEKTRIAFKGIERTGSIVEETDESVETISDRNEQALAASVRYPRILARNLLLALGANAVSRRVGVSSMRMDILAKTVDGYPGVVEVEFGDEAILDAPRDILDDVAVMVVRHGWKRGEFLTIIITDLLPNRRSEYWRIIRDIKIVTNVKVLTMSVLTLMMAVWRQKKLSRNMCDLSYVDDETDSYLNEVMAKVLNLNPNLTSGSSRIVEWVK